MSVLLQKISVLVKKVWTIRSGNRNVGLYLPFTAHGVVEGIEAAWRLDGLSQVADDSLSDADLRRK